MPEDAYTKTLQSSLRRRSCTLFVCLADGLTRFRFKSFSSVCFTGTGGIFGAHSSHSFAGLSYKGNAAPSFAGWSLGSSGVAKATPPPASDRRDSTLTSRPRNKLKLTSAPLTFQNLEPFRTNFAYRCLINARMATVAAFGLRSHCWSAYFEAAIINRRTQS